MLDEPFSEPKGSAVSRAWFRFTASDAPYSVAALIGLGLLIAAAWAVWPIAGMASLGLALFFLGVYGPAR